MSFKESEDDACPWCECFCDYELDGGTCDCHPLVPCPGCSATCEGQL